MCNVRKPLIHLFEKTVIYYITSTRNSCCSMLTWKTWIVVTTANPRPRTCWSKDCCQTPAWLPVWNKLNPSRTWRDKILLLITFWLKWVMCGWEIKSGLHIKQIQHHKTNTIVNVWDITKPTRQDGGQFVWWLASAGYCARCTWGWAWWRCPGSGPWASPGGASWTKPAGTCHPSNSRWRCWCWSLGQGTGATPMSTLLPCTSPIQYNVQNNKKKWFCENFLSIFWWYKCA